MKRLKRTIFGLFLLIVFAGAVFYRHPVWVAYKTAQGIMTLSGARSRYIQAGSHRIHYYEAAPSGSSPGTPLVLLHGLGSRGEDWFPLIPKLVAQGYHVYAPDLLGYGRSERPEVPYSISLEEQVVVDFMHAVHQPRAHLDGWSMGGWIAAKLALDHPEMVDRLVLDDGAGFHFKFDYPRTTFVPTDTASAHFLLSLLTSHAVIVPDFVLKADLAKAKRDGWVIQRTFDSMLSGCDNLDDRVHELSTPTLLIWGTEDRLVPFATAQSMHREIGHSVLVGIEGVGHLAPSEAPDRVLEATVAFLKAPLPIQPGEIVMPDRSALK